MLIAGAAAPAGSLDAAAPAEPAPSADLRTGATYTDLIRGREWWLLALHVPGAWRWSKGRGVTVAVLDTGVDARHPDLTGQVITGEDFTGGVRRPGTKYWGRHGSAMASIIAGHGHGTGMSAGVMGVAPQAKILSIRVTWENDDPVRDSSAEVSRSRDAVARGIRYAVDHGANIINMSLGGGKLFYNGSPIEEEAIRYALSKGVVLIASAGNDGAGLNRKNFPAAYPGVIAVGAVDRDMRPWRDSNRHAYVKVAAPGVDIVSADAGGGYVLGTGTSPSAAIVAGIAALIRSRYPKLTSVQVADAMAQGATPDAPGSRSTAMGAGVTDAVKAIYAAHKINAASAGRAVQPPQSAPQTTTEKHEGGLNILFIGALAGGGVLVVVGLLLSWLQRRRADGEEEHEGVASWPAEEQPHLVAAAASPGRHGPAGPAPVGVQPWQSMEAFIPPPAESIETPVWPPPSEQPAHPGGNGRGGGSGRDSWAPGALRALDVAAASPRPGGNRSTWRHGAAASRDDFDVDFGEDALVAGETGSLPEVNNPVGDESWRPVPAPQGRAETVGFPTVPPDAQATAAFRAVMGLPDEQPTGAFTAVPGLPDEPTGAFSAVPGLPDEQPTGAFSAVPGLPDEPTGAFSAVPGLPDEQPTGASNAVASSPDEQATTAFRMVAPRDEPAGDTRDGPRRGTPYRPKLHPADDEGHRLPWS